MQVLTITPNGSAFDYRDKSGQVLFTAPSFNAIAIGTHVPGQTVLIYEAKQAGPHVSILRKAQEEKVKDSPGAFIAFADGYWSIKEKVDALSQLFATSLTLDASWISDWADQLGNIAKILQSKHDLWASQHKAKYGHMDLMDVPLEAHDMGFVIGSMKNAISAIQEAVNQLNEVTAQKYKEL